MRRPAQTRDQRQHAREQRALLSLRRAAVRYSMATDDYEGDEDGTHRDEHAFAFADLCTACDRYREALSKRDAKKLAVRPSR